MSGSMDLRRYWIRLNPSSTIPAGFRLGIGITAHSGSEALELLRKIYPAEPDKFVVADIVEDVSLADLDPKHVLPNIGDWGQPGVWFPNIGILP